MNSNQKKKSKVKVLKKASTKKPKDKKTNYRYEDQQAFVKYMSLPDPEKCQMVGIPFDYTNNKYSARPTMTHFAEKYEVSNATLSAWHKKFAKEIEDLSLRWGSDKIPNVMASLYNNIIKNGDSAEVELFLAYYKGWNKKQVVETVERFDMEDIRALIEPLPKDKQDQFYATIANIINEAELYRGETQGDEPGFEVE